MSESLNKFILQAAEQKEDENVCSPSNHPARSTNLALRTVTTRSGVQLQTKPMGVTTNGTIVMLLLVEKVHYLSMMLLFY